MENPKKNITIPVDGTDNSMKSIDYISMMFDPDHNLEINVLYVMSSLPSLMADEKNTDKDVLSSISRAEARHLARAKRVLEKARRLLGFEAATKLEDALDEIIPWIKRQIEIGGI